MKSRFKLVGIATALALSLAGGGAFAAQVAPSASGEKQALVKAREHLASSAAQTKGAPRQEYELQEKRVDSLIDALEHGQRVSPSEVEKALEDARSAPF